jgi:hypothetical protein
MRIRSALKEEVTTPEMDAWLHLFAGCCGLVVAAIPPYGWRAVMFGALSVSGFFHSWRNFRKSKALKNTVAADVNPR